MEDAYFGTSASSFENQDDVYYENLSHIDASMPSVNGPNAGNVNKTRGAALKVTGQSSFNAKSKGILRFRKPIRKFKSQISLENNK